MVAEEICIVIPGYAASTPRAVKEADALHAAGYRVRLVSSRGNLKSVGDHDRVLLDSKPWEKSTVLWSPFNGQGEYLTYAYSKARFHVARALPLRRAFWASCAEGRVYPELAATAKKRRSALYIGHYPAGLAAAASAAAAWGAKLGYDLEDLYVAEHSQDLSKTARIQLIERSYLSRCSSVTAVSQAIAAEVSRLYHVPLPVTIHNVFPWADRNGLDGRILDRRGSKLSLYWYSQVIGLDRGIQDAIGAAGLLKGRVQIHLRGELSLEVERSLRGLARRHGIEEDLYFHPPVSPAELLSRAAEHDIGLALETTGNRSRELTVSNKLFFYLLAGLMVAVSAVEGQGSVFKDFQGAGFPYPPGDSGALAAQLNLVAGDPERLRRCKDAALLAARERWNWETESLRLIEHVRRVLA